MKFQHLLFYAAIASLLGALLLGEDKAATLPPAPLPPSSISSWKALEDAYQVARDAHQAVKDSRLQLAIQYQGKLMEEQSAEKAMLDAKARRDSFMATVKCDGGRVADWGKLACVPPESAKAPPAPPASPGKRAEKD